MLYLFAIKQAVNPEPQPTSKRMELSAILIRSSNFSVAFEPPG
jgi:hypothetical protein